MSATGLTLGFGSRIKVVRWFFICQSSGEVELTGGWENNLTAP
jgi:hypothetical protein